MERIEWIRRDNYGSDVNNDRFAVLISLGAERKTVVRTWTRRLILTSSLAIPKNAFPSTSLLSFLPAAIGRRTNSPSTSRTDRNGVQRLAGPLKSRSLIDKSMTNEINQWPSGYCGSLRSIRAAFSSSGKPEDSFCSIVFFETLVISRTIDVYSRYFILEKKKKRY